MRRRNDYGFTLVEVLVALALLATLSLFVWSASDAGGRTLQRIADGAARNAELLRLDAALRSAAQRILTPYWFSRPRSTGWPEALKIPFLDGNEESSLQLSFENGTFTLSDGQQNVRFTELLDARAELGPTAAGKPDALKVIVVFKGQEPVTIEANLGGVPFPVDTGH